MQQRCNVATVTERLWKRNLASRVSPEAFDSRRPSSVMNARPSLLIGPRVSTAIGTTVYVLSSYAYFECFLVAAFSAALPASIAVTATYEAATVSTTVASHIKDRPSFQGTRVWPSGLFPSTLVRPDGSLITGVPALLMLRRMMSFLLLCLACRPNPSEHDRPREHLAETGAPHTHVCGSHMADPSRRPTATLTASSLNLRLNVVSGRACSQSEACGAMEALRRARS